MAEKQGVRVAVKQARRIIAAVCDGLKGVLISDEGGGLRGGSGYIRVAVVEGGEDL